MKLNLIWHMDRNMGGGTHGVMVIVIGNGHGEQSSNPEQGCFISYSPNTLGKGMHLNVFPQNMGK